MSTKKQVSKRLMESEGEIAKARVEREEAERKAAKAAG